MEFKWYLIKCKLEDHAYLPRMVSSVELVYSLEEKTEDNTFLVKSQVLIKLPRPTTTKGYVEFKEDMTFERTVEKWCMDIISSYEEEVLLERDKLIKILNDMKSRKDLEKGALITEETVWGYGLGKNESGLTRARYIDPEQTELPYPSN
tara:strand:- start:640 stop:1086 length:447 start_codon:yes stop_codon:yes gene_type:complete